jgi:cytochrome c553
MRRNIAASLACLLLGAGGFAASAFAGDAAAGRQKSAACQVCHGPLGLATAPDAPNLAGQSSIYIAAQLKAYRDGTRKHEVMSLMAKPLSDADIDNLASWYASLKIQVQPMP